MAGFIIALGVAVIASPGEESTPGSGWALWTAFLAPVIGVGLALPHHYVYGIGTFGHLGLIYLDAGILLIGTLLAGRALAR